MDFYFIGWTFLVFFHNWEKRTEFHCPLYKLANFFQAGSLQNFCLTFYSIFQMHVCMTTTQSLQVVWYVQLRVQSHLQCSKVFTSVSIACYVSSVIVASTVFVSIQMLPEIMCPEPQEKQNTQNLCLFYIYQCSVIFQCYKFVHSLSSKYSSCIYLDVAWDQVPSVLGWLEQYKLCFCS